MEEVLAPGKEQSGIGESGRRVSGASGDGASGVWSSVGRGFAGGRDSQGSHRRGQKHKEEWKMVSSQKILLNHLYIFYFPDLDERKYFNACGVGKICFMLLPPTGEAGPAIGPRSLLEM